MKCAQLTNMKQQHEISSAEPDNDDNHDDYETMSEEEVYDEITDIGTEVLPPLYLEVISCTSHTTDDHQVSVDVDSKAHNMYGQQRSLTSLIPFLHRLVAFIRLVHLRNTPSSNTDSTFRPRIDSCAKHLELHSTVFRVATSMRLTRCTG